MAGEISGLSAMAAWAAGDLMEIVDVSDTSMAAGGTNKKTTLQDLMTVFTGSTVMRGDTVTTSKPLLDLTQTWNAAVDFTASKITITDTSSNTTSWFVEYYAGSTVQFAVRKNGRVLSRDGGFFCSADSNLNGMFANAGAISFYVANGVMLSMDNTYLKFGTHSAIGAETVTGYITIRDAANNLRKLAVVS